MSDIPLLSFARFSSAVALKVITVVINHKDILAFGNNVNSVIGTISVDGNHTVYSPASTFSEMNDLLKKGLPFVEGQLIPILKTLPTNVSHFVELAPYQNRTVTLHDCAVCGSGAYGRQWHNQDDGYAICGRCSAEIKSSYGILYLQDLFGVEGYHYNAAKPLQKLALCA